MALSDLEFLKERLMRDVRTFSESGRKIIERDGLIDATSLRTAANQFRQAAAALDQLDGIAQTIYYLKPNV